MTAKKIEAIAVTDNQQRTEYFNADGSLLDTKQQKYFDRNQVLRTALQEGLHLIRNPAGVSLEKIELMFRNALEKESGI